MCHSHLSCHWLRGSKALLKKLQRTVRSPLNLLFSKIDDTSHPCVFIPSSWDIPFIPFTSYFLGFNSMFLMVSLSHTNPSLKYCSTWYSVSVSSSANYFVTIFVDSQSWFLALSISFQLFSIFFCLFPPSSSRTETNTKQNETLTFVETSRIVIQIAKSCENSSTHKKLPKHIIKSSLHSLHTQKKVQIN